MQKRYPSRNWILVTKQQILRKEFCLKWVLWGVELTKSCFLWMSLHPLQIEHLSPCSSMCPLHVLTDIIFNRPEKEHLSAHLSPPKRNYLDLFPSRWFPQSFQEFNSPNVSSWHLFRICWSYWLEVWGQCRYWPPILWKPSCWMTLTICIFFRNIQHLSAFFCCENGFFSPQITSEVPIKAYSRKVFDVHSPGIKSPRQLQPCACKKITYFNVTIFRVRVFKEAL